MPAGQKYFGKYRGTVLNNVDPQMQGRIMAMVPDVLGPLPTTWALPCLPFVGLQQGLFCVPPIGAGVWIEFEQGDPDYPIWVGGWWSQADFPSAAKTQPPGVAALVIQTLGQNSLVVSDAPGPLGGIQIKTLTGAMILVNDIGITLDNGKGASITMTGPTVDVNKGGLTVV